MGIFLKVAQAPTDTSTLVDDFKNFMSSRDKKEEGVLSQIEGIKNKLDSSAPGKLDYFQWTQAMSELSAALTLLGYPGLTAKGMDPEIIETKLTERGFGPLFRESPDNIIKFAKALSEFATDAVILKSQYPDIGNLILSWAAHHYDRHLNINETIQEMNKLGDMLKNRMEPKDSYVIAVLNRNYALASTLLMMYSFSDILKGGDPELFKDLASLTNTARKMLGPQSAEHISNKALMTEQAKTKFRELQKARAQFRLLAPVAMEFEKNKQAYLQILTSMLGSDAANTIVNTPIFRGLFSGILGLDYAKNNWNSSTWNELTGVK